MSEIGFDQVEKSFGSRTVIRRFTLEVANGEFMVLLGPSGCGKSTLLRMLAGLEPVSAGRICIGGNVVNEWTPQQRNVAMVFQNYALYPHMSVRQNLAFPLRMRGVGRAQIAAKVEEAARTLDLAPLLDRTPRQLSGGQRQRVAMGRAIVRDPAAFLMDEPLSNLDAKLRVQIRGEIAALQEQLGTTTLYVTHDQVEAMTLGQRVAVINQGVLQQVGTPKALYRRPANVFIAGFLGNPPMNLIPAVIESRAGVPMLRFGSLDLRLPAVPPAGVATVGLRPEAFAWAQDGAPNQVTVKIGAVESLGHEQIIYFRLPETPPASREPHAVAVSIAARLGADKDLRPYADVTLAVDLEDLHWFGPDGNRL